MPVGQLKIYVNVAIFYLQSSKGPQWMTMIIFAIIANDNEYDHGGRLRMTRMIICLKGGFLHIQSKHVYTCYILTARPWKPWWLEEYFPFGIVPFQGVTYVNLQESIYIYICRLNVVEWTAPPPPLRDGDVWKDLVEVKDGFLPQVWVPWVFRVQCICPTKMVPTSIHGKK